MTIEAKLHRLGDFETIHAADDRKRLSLSLSDFLAVKTKPRRNLLPPWLQSGGLTMVHAWRGVGKTHFASGVACAVAGATAFLKWTADNPARVLYVDGEMPASLMQERFRDATIGAPV